MNSLNTINFKQGEATLHAYYRALAEKNAFLAQKIRNANDPLFKPEWESVHSKVKKTYPLVQGFTPTV